MIGRLGKIILAITTVLALASLGSCALLKKDVVAVADVCRPELLPDAEQAAPYIAAYITCELSHAVCEATLAQLEALGKADAIACGIAEAHAATVKLATVGGAGSP